MLRLAAISGLTFALLLGPAALAADEVRVEPRPGDEPGSTGLTVHVDVPVAKLGAEASGFTRVEIEGFGVAERRPGAPDLPSRILRIAIPPDGSVRIDDVRVLGERVLAGVVPRPVATEHDDVLAAADARASGRAGGEPVPGTSLVVVRGERLVPDPTRYGPAAGPTPAARAWLGETGVLRRQRYVELHIAPARFDPEDSSLRLADRVEVDLTIEGVAPSPDVPTLEPAFEPVYRNAIANYEQGLGFRLDVAGAAATESGAVAQATFDGARYRILVSDDGMVRLDHALMSGTALAAEPLSTWKVTNRGVEVPLDVRDADADDVLDPGDWVQFWGQALDDEAKTALNSDLSGPVDLWEARDFTDVNTYFVGAEIAGDRARMVLRDAIPTNVRTPPADFVETARAEIDDAWQPLGSADPWYWSPSQNSSNNQTRNRTEPVALPGLSGGDRPATLRVRLRGETENADLFPDHASRVLLRNDSNQTLASQDDDGTWDGRTIYDHELAWTYPGSGAQLTDPAQVRIEALAASGTAHSFILDRIEIDYRRSFTAVADALVFRWPDEEAEFVVDGFTGGNIRVYELTGRVAGGEVVDTARLLGGVSSGSTTYSVRFRIDPLPEVPDGEDRTFVVVGPTGFRVPTGPEFAEDPVSDLRSTAIEADIVVVAHPDVGGPASRLQDLLAYRLSSQGLTSKIAYVPDIEDEFNEGLPGPVAIRNFLAWVMSDAPGEGWSGTNAPKPTYVLLVGDGSYDYKAGTAGGSFVPTQILFKDDPSIGYYASDNVLAAVVGDDQLADLVVGRIPARSIASLDVVIDKLLGYEQSPPAGTWTRHSLFMSDKGKGTDPTFEALEFERLNEEGEKYLKIPPHTSKKLRYFSDYGGNQPSAMRQAIKDAVNGVDEFDGAATAQFVGHGNFVVWSDDAFFDERNPPPRDTDDLVNGLRLPWLLVHNCLTGGFHTTQEFSMGEDWLMKSGGGSIATYAPSGLGFRFIGEVVIDEIFDDLYGPPKIREMGTAVMNSVANLCGQGSIEACQYYVLLGDPTTRLQIPEVAPATDVAATGGNAEVQVDWIASATPAVTYDVYRATAPTSAYTLAGSTAATSFLDTDVVNAKTYYYHVVARDPEGFESRWSNFNSDCGVDGPDCVKATPLNPNPPGKPTGVVVTDAETGGRLDVSWSANPEDDVRMYLVYWGEQPGVYTDVSPEIRGGVTSYAITGLTNGIPYHVVVTATNTSGLESDPSNEQTEIPNLVLGVRAPAFVSDLAVDKSGTDAVLTWGAVTEDIYGKAETVSTYEVFRDTTPDFVPTEANRVAQVATTSFTDTGALAPGGPDYHWLVRAVDVDGNPGGTGRQLPDGIGDLSVAKSQTTPGNLEYTWTPVTTDFDGGPTVVVRYDVYGRDTPFTRADIRDGLVPLLDSVVGTSLERTPAEQRKFLSVIAVDARGNESPF